ncbi:phage tail protein [Oceanospirillum maris]|uniref:phage tail protein n=1 Tax=Oceanospirillum maris TaxID=64977 RepID=UPI000481B2DD|nr:tail fiber protein [Oceanospirillum maris]
MSEPFIAEIRLMALNFAPRGWAFCDGQLLPIAQNTALFSLIGTTYGGDGRTTTALPNLQDRVPMHPGRGPGLTSRRLGQRVGVDTVTLSEAQIPSHTHTYRAVQANSTTNEPNGNLMVGEGVPGGSKGAIPVEFYKQDATNMVSMSSASLTTAGGGQSHENRQPYLTLNYCIALTGLYPSRG